eukprot:6209821-Pleurochrysis_carterae.AAC.3
MTRALLAPHKCVDAARCVLRCGQSARVAEEALCLTRWRLANYTPSLTISALFPPSKAAKLPAAAKTASHETA